MGKKVVVFLAAVLVLTFSSAAQAIDWSDDFNDIVMDSMWSKEDDGDANGPYLSETGSVLQWLPTVWTTGVEQYESYGLQYEIDFTNDFGFKVQFNNTYTGATGSALGVNMSLNDHTEDGLYVEIGVDYIGEAAWEAEGIDQTWGNGKVFFAGLELGESETFEVADRGIDAGWMGIRYFVDGDKLQAGVFASDDFSGDPIMGLEYVGFTEDYGVSSMWLSIGGWSEGDTALSGGAYLDNFSGTVTPEPVSSILFLVGGASLVAAKMKRKKKS